MIRYGTPKNPKCGNTCNATFRSVPRDAKLTHCAFGKSLQAFLAETQQNAGESTRHTRKAAK